MASRGSSLASRSCSCSAEANSVSEAILALEPLAFGVLRVAAGLVPSGLVPSRLVVLALELAPDGIEGEQARARERLHEPVADLRQAEQAAQPGEHEGGLRVVGVLLERLFEQADRLAEALHRAPDQPQLAL